MPDSPSSQNLKARLSEWTVIARGNLSVCYRARDAALGRTVFVKTLGAPSETEPDLRARFLREARAVARLDHPNLVRLYEFGEDGELGLFMLLEWIDGTTLAAHLTQHGPLGAEELMRLAADLFAGLDALHAAGVLHRDLKPENILRRSDGNYKISDFSLAAMRDEPRLTHHKAIVGTPAYMAPEQAAGRAADERGDLFAAGVVLYEAATGNNPFAAEDVMETLRRIRGAEPDFNHANLKALPEPLPGLIRSCLEKNPAARPSGARAAAAQLLPLTPVVIARRHNPLTPARTLGAAAIVLAAVIGAVLLQRSPLRWHNPAALPETPTQGFPAVRDTVVESVPTDSSLRDESELHDSLSSPALLKKPPVREATAVTRVDSTARAPAVAESAEVWLDIEPWATVDFHGARLGTSPLRAPLKLPVGNQTLGFQNASLPRIEREFEIRPGNARFAVRLLEAVVTLQLDVEPWGDVRLDGEDVGTTPLAQPLFFLPGRHTLKISHGELPAVERTFQTRGGDTLVVHVNLYQSTWDVKTL